MADKPTNTKILFCGCDSAYQDAKYGSHNRAHNATIVPKPAGGWRCTVCGSKK